MSTTLLHTARAGFFSYRGEYSIDHRGVPTAGHRNRHGIAGAAGRYMAMQALIVEEHRNAEPKNCRVALRRSSLIDARRSATEDQPARRVPANLVGRQVMPHDLAIDVVLADAASDELRVLGPKIENENPLYSRSPQSP